MKGLKHSTHSSGSRESIRHSYSMNIDGVPLSRPPKLNVAARLLLTAGGASRITVSGGSVSWPM